MLDAPRGDLSIYRIVNFALRLAHLLGNFFAAADDIERSPGEQRRDGIEIGAVGIAADPRRLKRNRAAAAKRIADARHMSEPALAQLAHQLRQRVRARAEVRVDFIPRLLRRPIDLLRPIASRDLIFVRLAKKNATLEIIEKLAIVRFSNASSFHDQMPRQFHRRADPTLSVSAVVQRPRSSFCA